MTDQRTPIGQLPPFELTSRLDNFVRQAYFRRSRQLPANLSDMVDCLKGDLLKHFKDCPIGTVDDAITTSTLFDNDKPVSVAFFFEAVKKRWWQPKSNVHNWEEEPTRPDTEADTLALLDTCAAMVAEQDNADEQQYSPLTGIMELPAFNPRRSFAYLVERKQLTAAALDHFFDQALLDTNRERLESRHHRLTREQAATDPDVAARQKRLAVIDWLRACNTQGRKPSQIITPDETSYQFFRYANN